MDFQTTMDRRDVENGCCSNSTLMPIEQAIDKALALTSPVKGVEIVSLSEALGRICLSNIHAALPLPSFDNSAMDGYALNRSSLIGEGPYRVKIIGRIAAGDTGYATDKDVPEGALRILTGALVPTGYDAVIMQEFCTVDGDYIGFDKCPPVGKNIRPSGEDCRQDDLLITSGTRIGPRHISLLAAQGYDEVAVCRKVRVAIFSTGSELRLPGQSLSLGQIYNSNRYTLASQLDLSLVELIDLGAIKDNPELLKAAMAKAAAVADMVITTGGVSVGDEDHMPDVITSLGGTLHVRKVAIKPGKPVVVGKIGNAVFLGLPGNPVAAYLNQMLIGTAIISKLSGSTFQRLVEYPATVNFSCKSPSALQEYVLARIVSRAEDGSPVVEAFKKANSAALLALAQSDGFIVLPAGLSHVEPGDKLTFIPH